MSALVMVAGKSFNSKITAKIEILIWYFILPSLVNAIFIHYLITTLLNNFKIPSAHTCVTQIFRTPYSFPTESQMQTSLPNFAFCSRVT